MSTEDWRRVPVGPDARRWVTRGECKTVLVIVHTVTSGQRLLDAVHLIESDLRIQVVYTKAPDVFSNGVSTFLRYVGGVVLPWQQATRTGFDVTLTASLGGLHDIQAPLVVLPHGAGFNKLAVRRTQGMAVGSRLTYGLDPQRLVHDGALVPAALVLAHRAELRRLSVTCPEALPAAVVVGDPCFDRLAASRADQQAYRSALGVPADRRLVVVSSTWGPGSLLGRRFDLLPRLLRELPSDRYRVLALVHPNVWFGHGSRQLRAWLADCLNAGLCLLPPDADWRAALAAADCVIGDHGSVTLYGAAAGVPVLSAGFPAAEVDPDSAMAELAETAPLLAEDAPVRPAIEKAFAEFHPHLHRRAVQQITSAPGRFNRNMRQLLYRLLGLAQPATLPVTRPVPAAVLDGLELI